MLAQTLFRQIRVSALLPAPDCVVRLAFTAVLLCQASGYAQTGPQPPCGNESVSAYPDPGSAPVAKFWSESEFGHDWRPPACTGWTTAGFATLVTTAGRFRYTAGAEGLLRRVGAISERAGIRYWSTTHQRWQTLVVSAHASVGPESGPGRQAFTVDEMTAGKVLYLDQVDNLTGSAIYRMHIDEASPNRLVFDIENVSTVRYLILPLFHPGEIQSIYFLDRESDDVWRYYSISRTGRNSSSLVAGHEASTINRAVAYYRFLAGIPTDQEPPAAR